MRHWPDTSMKCLLKSASEAAKHALRILRDPTRDSPARQAMLRPSETPRGCQPDQTCKLMPRRTGRIRPGSKVLLCQSLTSSVTCIRRRCRSTNSGSFRRRIQPHSEPEVSTPTKVTLGFGVRSLCRVDPALSRTHLSHQRSASSAAHRLFQL